MLSVREFAEICGKIAGTNVTVQEADAIEKLEASPIISQVMNNDDLKDLGWEPIFAIYDGIEHSIRIRKDTLGEM